VFFYTTTRAAWHAVGLSCMSASRTRPATLGGKLSRKHVSVPRSEAVGLKAAVVGSWRGRYCGTRLAWGNWNWTQQHRWLARDQPLSTYFASLIGIPRDLY